MSDLIERKSIRNLYSCLNPNDRVLVGQVLIDIDAIPSADVPTTMTGVIDAIREAEYRGYMGVYIKGMKMPESCILCRLECLYRIHSSSVRSKYCPLIEIAEPKDEPQTDCAWK